MKGENESTVPVIVSTCTYCGSTNIARNVRVDQTGDAGRIGLCYHTRFLLDGMEPLYADLCDDCGSLVRTYVRKVRQKWVTK
jgi:hypothetical protein